MPCIWGNYSNAQIFLNVAIFTEDMAQRFIGGKRDNIKLAIFKSLIDTGAQSTCITKKLADLMGLIPIGTVSVHGIDGPVDHNNYLFYIGFALGETKKEDKTFRGQINILQQPIQGAEFINKIPFPCLKRGKKY